MPRRTSVATIRLLHGLALLSSGLVFGLTLSHVLQAPGSRRLDGAEWLNVMHTFYGGFAVVGGIAEVLGLIAAVALTVVMLVQRKTVSAIATMVAALSMLGTLAAYWFGNRPVNALVTNWTSTTLPSDWSAFRDVWETAHAVSAGLSAVAFIAISLVLLATVYPTKHEV
ncbi:hypothetical protein [Brevibacterium sp. FME37]|uniref:hypothetical protein n=1 Tax=Brevibacterium sp. FME37 TaxID=2742607 RepID=UPI0018684E82|nr:hypothetical protein [Brevibacterium sp. FME37]